MAEILIDGKPYQIPVMKFKTLKLAYPIVQEAQGADDPISMAEAGFKVLSLAMIKENPDMTPDWLEENMNASEVPQIGPIIVSMLRESGLLPDGKLSQGEAEGAAPSTETLTPSLPNSSQPDAAAEIGTQ